jgi:hypothetical protein
VTACGRPNCHAEGRGFESLQPLRPETPLRLGFRILGTPEVVLFLGAGSPLPNQKPIRPSRAALRSVFEAITWAWRPRVIFGSECPAVSSAWSFASSAIPTASPALSRFRRASSPAGFESADRLRDRRSAASWTGPVGQRQALPVPGRSDWAGKQLRCPIRTRPGCPGRCDRCQPCAAPDFARSTVTARRGLRTFEALSRLPSRAANDLQAADETSDLKYGPWLSASSLTGSSSSWSLRSGSCSTGDGLADRESNRSSRFRAPLPPPARELDELVLGYLTKHKEPSRQRRRCRRRAR